MADTINPVTGQAYYSGGVDDIKALCKALNIGEGKLSTITTAMVEHYMGLVDGAIDGYLTEYYFIPIVPYNQVMPDGKVKKVFPGKLRMTAQYWTAGLLLSSEFQNLEQNINEASKNYVEESKKELFQITLYNQRLPGQRMKSAVSKTMPPSLQPGMFIEKFD